MDYVEIVHFAMYHRMALVEVMKATAERYADWMGIECMDAATARASGRDLWIINGEDAPLYFDGVGKQYGSFSLQDVDSEDY